MAAWLSEIYAAHDALKDSPDPVDKATARDLQAMRSDLICYGAGDRLLRLKMGALRRRLARRSRS
jgi:hypothetical protein